MPLCSPKWRLQRVSLGRKMWRQKKTYIFFVITTTTKPDATEDILACHFIHYVRRRVEREQTHKITEVSQHFCFEQAQPAIWAWRTLMKAKLSWHSRAENQLYSSQNHFFRQYKINLNLTVISPSLLKRLTLFQN